MSLRTRLFCTMLESRDNPSDPGLIPPTGSDTSTPPTNPTTPVDNGSMSGGAGDLGGVGGTGSSGGTGSTYDPVLLNSLLGGGSTP